MAAQLAGKLRDLFICQICGSSEEPQGHHLFDVSFGGSANAENIITLCAKHHKKIHKGLIDIIKF